jgi:hypothetical protein
MTSSPFDPRDPLDSVDVSVRRRGGGPAVGVHLTENTAGTARLLVMASQLGGNTLVVHRPLLLRAWPLLVPDLARGDQAHRYADRGKGNWASVVLKNGIAILEEHRLVQRQGDTVVRLLDLHALEVLVTAWDDHLHGPRPAPGIRSGR